MQAFIVGLFALWLTLSIIVYIPKVTTAIRRRDHLMLIPTWKFFAPTPGERDMHVLYQDRYEDGTVTLWTEIGPAVRRPWWGFVWNPAKRTNKALFDVIQELGLHVTAGDPVLELSMPYLSLLNHISSIPRSTSPAFTKFLLMCSRGNVRGDEPEVVYVSRFHQL